MHKNFKIRPLVAALISVIALQSCATHDKNGKKLSIPESFKETFDSDDPCSNSKRNVGIALGAVAGAAIGTMVSGDGNKAVAIAVGALAGSGIGALIGREIDNRQCEISKIQKKYNADIEMNQLAVIQPNSATRNDKSITPNQTQNVGLSVSVMDKDNKPQFASNSSDIQPESKAMFAEISQKYTLPKGDNSKELYEAVKTRRILLIGHTDDGGSSQLNANLSERRAKAVAKVFKDSGVPENMIYYQGAGETLPIADNSTPEGRAKNRRVEIVDLNDEGSFKTYLENRRPVTAFYRPNESVKASNSNISPKNVKPEVNKSSVKTEPVETASTENKQGSAKRIAQSTSVKSKKPTATNIIDFSGMPFSIAQAKLNSGEIITSKKFSLISTANASDISRIETCNIDRPRNTGAVKSLKDGSEYKTVDYLPGLYGRSWYDMVGGNLVVLNKVAVLRDGALPANKPELKVYTNYKSASKNPKPAISQTPEVNSYQTSEGIVYRVFVNGDRGVQCMDILMPLKNENTAKQGKLIYGNGAEFVSDFKPRIRN